MCVDSREKTSSLHREDVWKRVADFVSRRKWAVSWVQRQIRHVIRASRSWICCSRPKWDYFAMFFVDSCINMLSNLLQTCQFGFLMIWTLDVWVFTSALWKPCCIRPALSTISVDHWTQRLPCMKPEVVRKHFREEPGEYPSIYWFS